jgi:hypothetical protein
MKYWRKIFCFFKVRDEMSVLTDIQSSIVQEFEKILECNFISISFIMTVGFGLKLLANKFHQVTQMKWSGGNSHATTRTNQINW